MLSIQEIDTIQIDYNMASFDEQCLVDKFNRIYNVLIKFYNRNRAVILTNYIYNAYRIITGNR